MKILVTNDDGVEEPALWALVEAVKNLGDVTVVAPAGNQSGVGSAISFRKSIKFNEYESKIDGVDCYTVEGTPADCSIIGIKHILNHEADVVVSGINPGFNTSRNMFISGTFGAAMIGSANGVKSAAFSMDAEDDFFDPQIRNIITGITQELISPETPTASLFNINFPSLSLGGIKGAEGCAQAQSQLSMILSDHPDGGFEVASGLSIKMNNEELTPGTDVEVLERGMVALTAVNGANLQNLPNDPSLKRMIDAANRVIG